MYWVGRLLETPKFSGQHLENYWVAVLSEKSAPPWHRCYCHNNTSVNTINWISEKSFIKDLESLVSIHPTRQLMEQINEKNQITLVAKTPLTFISTWRLRVVPVLKVVTLNRLGDTCTTATCWWKWDDMACSLRITTELMLFTASRFFREPHCTQWKEKKKQSTTHNFI